MSFLIEFYNALTPVAQASLILASVTALGLALGNIKVFGVSLEIAGVLFVGLIFGHFHFTVNHEMMDFAREFGLILFVYTIGIQVGPGFVSSLRKEGLKLNIMAAGIVALGVVMTLIVHFVGHVDAKAAVGLYSGGVTNTPSLAAASQAIRDLNVPNTEAAVKIPGLGYAIAYPFGVIGIILSMFLIRLIFRVDTTKEVEALHALQKAEGQALDAKNLEVTNPNLYGVALQDVPGIANSGVVVSRIMDDGNVSVAELSTVLKPGNVLLAVGPPDKINDLKLIVGGESSVDLRKVAKHLQTKRIIVTKGTAIGKSIEELNLPNRFSCQITRVNRTEIELPVTLDFKLQFADSLTVVGEESDLQNVIKELGNSATKLNHPQLMSMFIGIALGVILGSIPIHVPGIPAPVKLGLAGGPLIVAILLSRIGQIGKISWYMPISANFMLRQVGIALFLAGVGLKAGDAFVETLMHGDGLLWVGWGAAITLLPLMIVAVIGRGLF
ncbi:MAG: putative transporter, partial [Armatimonadota bacterium]